MCGLHIAVLVSATLRKRNNVIDRRRFWMWNTLSTQSLAAYLASVAITLVDVVRVNIFDVSFPLTSSAPIPRSLPLLAFV